MSPPEVREPRPSDRTRPAEDGSDTNEAILERSGDIAAQLQRRREAASRLPPLESGKRDPWDLYPSDGAA